MTDLTAPRFHDEDAAREHIEASRWPNGVACPFCGSLNIRRMEGKTQAGMFLCNDCRDKFTCRTGTVMERSHIPLHKWLLAIHLMASSKKGVSAHQLMRNLDLGSYRTAWFLARRIREAMNPPEDDPPMGGKDKVVEADETFLGKQPYEFVSENRAGKPGWRKKSGTSDLTKVMTLVERGGRARSVHIPDLKAKTLRKVLVTNADRASELHTDEAPYYRKVGREFAKHETVNHRLEEYARGSVTTNTVEGFFSIFKRGMKGVYQHCDEKHLRRYLVEFDFRYSNRSALGVEDAERAARALKGAEGRRLMYRQPDCAGTC